MARAGSGSRQPVRECVKNELSVNPHLSDLISDCQRVPLLEAYVIDGKRVCIVLDGRLGLELDEEEACAVIPFIANCIETALRH